MWSYGWFKDPRSQKVSSSSVTYSPNVRLCQAQHLVDWLSWPDPLTLIKQPKCASEAKVQNQFKTFSEEVFVYALVGLLIWVLGDFVTLLVFVPMWPRLGSALGGVPSPFDCFLCNRGLKTLHLRMERHFKNGMAAAKFLEADPRVERVIFPGDLSAVECSKQV